MPDANFTTLITLVLGITILSLGFAGWLANWVLAKNTGNESMRKISDAIKEGAETFLRRQNRTILILSAIFAVALFVGYGMIRDHHDSILSPVPCSWPFGLPYPSYLALCAQCLPDTLACDEHTRQHSHRHSGMFEPQYRSPDRLAGRRRIRHDVTP